MMRQRQGKVGAFWLRAKIVPFLAILTILFGAAAILATRVPAMASGSYNNADIATDALTHVGEKYGECWPFVRDMIYQASNHTQDITAAAGGNDYFLHLQNAGGTRITDINALSKGDVVQKGQYGGHTFIIVRKVSVSGSTATYNVVDSNHANDDKVMNYNRTFSLGDDQRAYRFGTVATTPLRIGALYISGAYQVKEGTLSSGWHVETNDSTTQALQDGTLTGVVWNGQLLVKRGNLDGSWNTQVSSGVVQASISDTDGTTPIRIGVVKTDGTFWVREGLNGTWVLEQGSVTAGYVSGNRIAALLSDGTFEVKEGGLGAGWVLENGSVSQGIISGGSNGSGLIGVVIGGTLLVKQGGLGAGWVTENGAVANAQLSNATSQTPARIGYIDTAGNYWAKEGISGGWVLENGSVSQAALSGNLIGVVIGGTLYVKQGGLGAGWVTEQGTVAKTALWSQY